MEERREEKGKYVLELKGMSLQEAADVTLYGKYGGAWEPHGILEHPQMSQGNVFLWEM